MIKKSRVETIEEYLARGGEIKKVQPQQMIEQPDAIRKMVAGGPVTILSLEDADLFYGEARKGFKPKKTKPSLKIDINALPQELRAKYINKLKEEADGEIDEETEEFGDEED